MTRLQVASVAQRDAVLDLVRWFDAHSSSVHHALIMAAQHNEASAAEVEAEAPMVAKLLRESSTSWRRHAASVLELDEKLVDAHELDDLNVN